MNQLLDFGAGSNMLNCDALGRQQPYDEPGNSRIVIDEHDSKA
jgi:hypothetical protein